jgi:hypothetical protein
MRVSDLQEFSTTSKKVERILTKKGYKKLGAGVDQTAYLEPSTGLVLKVFGTQGGESFSPDHKMFFDWAKYCMKNPNNPFLPKFSGYESFVLDGDRYLQIRQELLKPAGRVGFLLGLFSEVLDDEGSSTLQDIEDYVAESYPSYMPDLQKLKKQLGPKGLQLLFSTMLTVYRKSTRRGYTFDLHAGNFMTRSDGTPVIVDPWVVDNNSW